PMLTVVAVVRGVDSLAQDRPDEAYGHLGPLFDMSPGTRWPIATQAGFQFFVDAALLTDHDAEARDVTDEVERRVHRSGNPTLAATVMYARALLAPPERAEGAFTAAFQSEH